MSAGGEFVLLERTVVHRKFDKLRSDSSVITDGRDARGRTVSGDAESLRFVLLQLIAKRRHLCVDLYFEFLHLRRREKFRLLRQLLCDTGARLSDALPLYRYLQ